jgi:hypothetical protein
MDEYLKREVLKYQHNLYIQEFMSPKNLKLMRKIQVILKESKRLKQHDLSEPYFISQANSNLH